MTVTQALIRATLEHVSCGRHYGGGGSITAHVVRHGLTWVVHVICKH